MSSCLRLFIFRFGVLTAFLLTAGCSVDMFSSAVPDSGEAARENYRLARPECAGLRLARPELDSGTFRSMVKCFGANGSIPELSKGVGEASDETVRGTVDLLNGFLFADPSGREEVRAFVRGMRREGRWNSVWQGFSGLLRRPESLRAFARFLSLGGRDPLLARTLEKIDPEETRSSIEWLGRLVSSRPFAELSRKIRLAPLTAGERERLETLLVDFVARPSSHHSARNLLSDMVAGKSAETWDYAFGKGDRILESTSRFTLLLRDLAGADGLVPLARIHQSLRSPIACWGGGKTFAHPWENLARELEFHAKGGSPALTDFTVRFAAIAALGASEFCEVPAPFLANYGSMMNLTAGRVGGEYLGLLERITRSGFARSAGDFIGEWGEPVAEALKILEPKPWFGDLVLLIAELESEDRDRLAGWFRLLLRERDAWSAWSSATTLADLRPVFSDLGDLLGAEPAALVTALDSVAELFGRSRSHPWFTGLKRVALESEKYKLTKLTESEEFPKVMAAVGRMAEDGRLPAILGDVLELLAGAERGPPPSTMIQSAETARKPPRHAFCGEDLKNLSSPAPLDESLLACTRLDPRRRPREQWENYRECLKGGGIDAERLEGTRLGDKWGEGEASGSFVGTLIHSLVAVPMTNGEKREIIASLTRDGDGAATSLLASLERVRGRLEGSAIFEMAHRLQAELNLGLAEWRGFFARVEAAILDPRFISVARAGRAFLADRAAASGADAAFSPAARPPSKLTAAWIRELECESDAERIARRATEIDHEFGNAVRGWDRVGGTLPDRWTAEELRPRVRAFAGMLKSPRLRENLYAWLAGQNLNATATWFFERARDPKLVAVMDPATGDLRVRWMTSLDRLESILVNSDVTFLLKENYGLRFIGKLAEAWGDEPRARWPLEIQSRYPRGRVPPKLADVYEEIVLFVRGFEKVGGIPSAPKCVRDGPITRAAIDDPWVTAPDLLIPFSVKAKAFNLRQNLDVVRENLPGSGHAGAGGMRFLRDLFWAVHASAPAADRDARIVERNPLRFFQVLGTLGGLRSISRGIQPLSRASERAALPDAFAALGRLVREPAFDRIIANLLTDRASLDAWVGRAVDSDDFQWGEFAYRAIDALAADRFLRLAPAFVRFVAPVLGDSRRTFPREMVGDLLLRVGTPGSLGEFRIAASNPSAAARVELAEIARFVEERILSPVPLPILERSIRLMEGDARFRESLFREWDRQLNDGAGTTGLSSGVDAFLSPDRPAWRLFVARWTGRSAARYAFAFASHPDEAFLILDAALRASQSAAFSDLLHSAFRELPDHSALPD